MGIFKPFWDTTNQRKGDKAITAIRTEIDEESLLQEIAAKAPLAYVRIEAINKLTDQDFLRTLLKDENPNIRLAAVKRTTDEAVIAQTVVNDDFDKIIEFGIDRISDENLLAEIAIRCRMFDLKPYKHVTEMYDKLGVTNLQDDELRFRLARTTVNNNQDKRKWVSEMSKRLMFKINNQNLLERIYIESEHEYVNSYAFDFLTDKEVLLDLYSRVNLSENKRRTLEIRKNDKLK